MTETERVEAALKAVAWPPFVKDRKWEVDVDSTGDRAIWIWVAVSGPDGSGADAASWDRMRQSIQEALSANGLNLWPYVRVMDESEQPTERR
jgi:hypothetical protein